MSTVPAACPGRSLTVIDVDPPTSKQGLVGVPGHGVAVTPVVSTVTRVALNREPDEKPVPAIVIVFVPPMGPSPGVTLVTVGTGAYAYSSAAVTGLVPPGVSTVMSTVPAACEGRP